MSRNLTSHAKRSNHSKWTSKPASPTKQNANQQTSNNINTDCQNNNKKLSSTAAAAAASLLQLTNVKVKSSLFAEQKSLLFSATCPFTSMCLANTYQKESDVVQPGHLRASPDEESRPRLHPETSIRLLPLWRLGTERREWAEVGGAHGKKHEAHRSPCSCNKHSVTRRAKVVKSPVADGWLNLLKESERISGPSTVILRPCHWSSGPGLLERPIIDSLTPHDGHTRCGCPGATLDGQGFITALVVMAHFEFPNSVVGWLSGSQWEDRMRAGMGGLTRPWL